MSPQRHRLICSVAYTHYRCDPRVRREAEALAERGDDVTVIALAERGKPEVDDVDGVRVIGLPIRRHRGDGLLGYATGYGRFFLRAAAHLTRRARDYDLVHVHSLPEAMVFAAAVPKLIGRPVLLDVHDLSSEVFASRRGSVPMPVRLAERLALRFADRVVTVHEDYRQRVSARGVKADHVTVVLNTPDDRRFPLRVPSVPSPAPTLIYHGTFVERYGLAAAIEALAAVKVNVPDVRLALIGDGDFRPDMIRLIDELGLNEHVHMSPGAVPIDEIAGHIAAAEIGIVPFLDDTFTRSILPTKLLEYVRAGLPVIVSRNPVIERYFSESDVYLVEPGNADEIAKAVLAIIDDPATAAAKALSAQQFFEREGWDANKARFLALVDAMTQRREHV